MTEADSTRLTLCQWTLRQRYLLRCVADDSEPSPTMIPIFAGHNGVARVRSW